MYVCIMEARPFVSLFGGNHNRNLYWECIQDDWKFDVCFKNKNKRASVDSCFINLCIISQIS